jgi:ribosomal protein S12 methylthiotransferase
LRRRVGTEIQVIVDELDAGQALGRSMADAPEIDGRVYLSASKGAARKGSRKLAPGDVITARVTAADEYDLWAEPA